MNHLFRLIVGDWSGDGHDISTEYYYHCNYCLNDIREAVRGFDLAEAYSKECSDYQQETYSASFMKALNANGIATDDEYAMSDEHVELYLKIARLKLPALEWKELVVTDYEAVGGYGLFGG